MIALIRYVSVFICTFFFFQGHIVDYFGRRIAIIINSIIFIVGALVLALSKSFSLLVRIFCNSRKNFGYQVFENVPFCVCMAS